MERYTKKKQDGSYVVINGEFHNTGGHINKLGRYEDVEEKHNIDLLDALSILDNGIWVRYDNRIFHLKPTLGFRGFRDDNYYYFEHEFVMFLPEDYGKTWAKTKEELKWKD